MGRHRASSSNYSLCSQAFAQPLHSLFVSRFPPSWFLFFIRFRASHLLTVSPALCFFDLARPRFLPFSPFFSIFVSICFSSSVILPYGKALLRFILVFSARDSPFLIARANHPLARHPAFILLSGHVLIMNAYSD